MTEFYREMTRNEILPYATTWINITNMRLIKRHHKHKPCESNYQFSSVTQSWPTLCNPMDCSLPGLPVHHQLLELTQTHVHWVGDAIQHIILCFHLLLLPLIFHSLRVLSNESILCIRWPKYWNFSFSISPSNEYSGLISFRMSPLI